MNNTETFKYPAEKLFESGFGADLISVTPPNAPLAPSSTLTHDQLGKSPGRKLDNGTWVGYNWRVSQATPEDVRGWSLAGANIGLRLGAYVAVDIDSLDPQLARLVTDLALAELGPAPIRIGRAPKRLLLYRALEPVGRVRVTANNEQELIEVLGMGQQCVMLGTHPVTMRPYTWDGDGTVRATELVAVSKAQIDGFVDRLIATLEVMGYSDVRRVGTDVKERSAVDQQGLLAPSIEALTAAIEVLGNDDTLAPNRDAYVRVGYAIKAAAGSEAEDEGYALFAKWAARHPRHRGDPDIVRGDWRRMEGDKLVGWNWIMEQAKRYGFEAARYEFPVLADTPNDGDCDEDGLPVVEGRVDENGIAPVLYSEQWLAAEVIRSKRGLIRMVPERGVALVWDGSRWLVDATLYADDIIKLCLRKLADEIARRGGTDKEIQDNVRLAREISTAGKVTSVRTLVTMDRSIAVSQQMLDADPWLLNTPAGIVDLKTGNVRPHDPDSLMTKITTVAPNFGAPHPEWSRFLHAVTGGDADYGAYLQRLAGYALVGVTPEQVFGFFYGEGGNGKGTFLRTLGNIMGDYVAETQADTFLVQRNEGHPTDMAALAGARLVIAHEVAVGKPWNEGRLKQFTGGDKVTARFMRQDTFTFKPQALLAFTANTQPTMREAGEAMRRRLHLVPFTIQPATRDLGLEDRLHAEYPAILAWMVEGALQWQANGLGKARVVASASDQYVNNEDVLGQFIAECCLTENATDVIEVQHLFNAWKTWAGDQEEYVGTMKHFAARVIARGHERGPLAAGTRRATLLGIKLRTDFLAP